LRTLKRLFALAATIGIVLSFLGLAVFTAPVRAGRSPHRYVPGRGAKCKKGYRRQRHGKKVFCVEQDVRKKATKGAPATSPSTPAPSTTPTGPLTSRITLRARLDPTYVQNPLSPYEVTYAFSAAATQQSFAGAVPVGGETPGPLPSGSLTLSSDGKQKCSVAVGSTIAGSHCTVLYDFELGHHTIAVTYTGGGETVTETVEEDLRPVPTKPILAARYWGYSQPLAIEPGVWRIGTLYIELGSVPSPGPYVELSCEQYGGGFEIGRDDCIQLETAAATHPPAVYATATGSCSEPTIDALSLSYPEWPEPQFRGPPMTPADIEAGAFHVRAFIWAYGGYAASEATAQVQFKPEVTLPPDC
jgi:hypothetical protein